MTPEELASRAGALCDHAVVYHGQGSSGGWCSPCVARAIRESIAEERAAILNIVEHISDDGVVPDCSIEAIADAIRART